MTELWLARDKHGYQLFQEEPRKRIMSPDDRPDNDWFWDGPFIAEDISPNDKKLLGLPTIRKGTKCKIQLTCRKVEVREAENG